MIEIFRGDTLSLTLVADNTVLAVGDTIRVGAKWNLNDTEYAMYKEIDIVSECSRLSIGFSALETDIEPFEDYDFHIKLQRSDGTDEKTIVSEKLSVKGAVIRVNRQ